ncbi:ORF99 [Leucania separata nucleopolyhedrovirus]|uniref:ORF99 n=1 Tax=Leucania separata nucleopolyhedrovirus TaxID=1307956 RepID=Q0IL20_NPVLS|nr:ORF99 [Leucania separata nucleopolyhedrovirus]AAR28863.1 ORF99 [Leucania separata nucleopolyhedrovirus]
MVFYRSRSFDPNMQRLNLYLGDPPKNLVNDKCDDCDVIYFEGIIESLTNSSCDKLSCFVEMKREEALLMKKACIDLKKHSSGNFFKYHALLDALLMYKTCVDLIDDSAWAANVLESCETLVTYMFKLFTDRSQIVVIIPPEVNYQEDNLSALLNHLLQQSIISLELNS